MLLLFVLLVCIIGNQRCIETIFLCVQPGHRPAIRLNDNRRNDDGSGAAALILRLKLVAHMQLGLVRGDQDELIAVAQTLPLRFLRLIGYPGDHHGAA